jgi:hypothetical protein
MRIRTDPLRAPKGRGHVEYWFSLAQRGAEVMILLKKPVSRELPISFDRRQWRVVLHPWGLEFRPKRARTTYTITWESVLFRTMEIAAEHARRDRSARGIGRRRKAS